LTTVGEPGMVVEGDVVERPEAAGSVVMLVVNFMVTNHLGDEASALIPMSEIAAYQTVTERLC
jgi:hypothetical protein